MLLGLLFLSGSLPGDLLKEPIVINNQCELLITENILTYDACMNWSALVDQYYNVNIDVDNKVYHYRVKEGDSIIFFTEEEKENYVHTEWNSFLPNGYDLRYNRDIDKEDYLFIDWSSELTNIQSNLEIKAIYAKEENNYTVELYIDNLLIDSYLVPSGASLELSPLPVKEGFILTGIDERLLLDVQQNLQIRGVFEREKYTVKFYDEDGQVIAEKEVLYGGDLEIILPTEIAGKKFLNWSDNLTNITSNLELHPVYQEEEFSIDIYLDDLLVDTQQVKYGSRVNLDQYKDLSIEWSNDHEITEEVKVEGKTVNNKFLITYFGFVDEIVKTELVESGGNGSFPVISATGYKFLSWNENLTNVKQDLLVYPNYQIATGYTPEDLNKLPRLNQYFLKDNQINLLFDENAEVDKDIEIDYVEISGIKHYATDLKIKTDKFTIFDRRANWIDIEVKSSVVGSRIEEIAIKSIANGNQYVYSIYAKKNEIDNIYNQDFIYEKHNNIFSKLLHKLDKLF